MARSYDIQIHVCIYLGKYSSWNPASYSENMFPGADAGMKLNISFTLPFEWNSTACINTWCRTVKILTCVYFLAPAKLLPHLR